MIDFGLVVVSWLLCLRVFVLFCLCSCLFFWGGGIILYSGQKFLQSKNLFAHFFTQAYSNYNQSSMTLLVSRPVIEGSRLSNCLRFYIKICKLVYCPTLFATSAILCNFINNFFFQLVQNRPIKATNAFYLKHV